MTTDTGTQAVKLMKGRKKRNKYSQTRPGYFWGKPKDGDDGVSDCSDSVRAVIKRVLGKDIGGNTSAQVDNRNKLGRVVHTTDGIYPDESKLIPGTTSLFFKGNAAHSMDVGHTELYIGDGQCMGHGSGIGPTIKNLKDYCKSRGTAAKRYFMAVDWDTEPGKVHKLGDRALSLGMVAPDVAEMQLLLVALHYDLGTTGPTHDGVDGDYGSLTAATVRAEQAHIGVAQTGNADLVTIAHIIAHAMGQPAPSTEQHVLVTGGAVNIRSGPDARYKRLGDTKSGTIFEASGQATDGWLGIRYKGGDAWISAKYAEVVE